MVKATTLKMNDGREIPVVGLGTYARGGSEGCQQAVETAIANGYRHFDTAAFYANEEEVGSGIKSMINKGTVTRDEIFLTTKIWNDKHAFADVVPSLKESLKKLGLDYVDLYLIHWPVAVKDNGDCSDIDFIETWRGMEECLKLGLAKTIGVSNFNIEQLEWLLKNCVTVPAVNQIEVNVNLTQKEMIAFCKKRGIIVTAYSPFGSIPSIRTAEDAPPPRADDPILTGIAKKYNKSTTQLVLRFLIDSGVVVIPKSVTPARIKENIDIFDFTLTPAEIDTIGAFNKDYRIVKAPFWKDFKNYPF